MCVLCGEMLEQLHWTDMEIKSIEESSTVVAGEHQRERKRSRLQRTRFCNDILSIYGLTLSEWNNSRFVLKNKTGKIEVVQNLEQIWEKAEEMLGYPVNPLDEKLLQQMKASV